MYIRTKDGRIIDTSKIATGSKFMDFATNDESFREIFKTEPLAKSENLEELCDAIVYECKNYYNIYQKYEIGNVDSLQWNKNNDLLSNIYGAIWTSKGLIYVAKMNSDGKLVLI